MVNVFVLQIGQARLNVTICRCGNGSSPFAVAWQLWYVLIVLILVGPHVYRSLQVSIAVSLHAFNQRRKRAKREELDYSPSKKLNSDIVRISGTEDEEYHPTRHASDEDKTVYQKYSPKECTL